MRSKPLEVPGFLAWVRGQGSRLVESCAVCRLGSLEALVLSQEQCSRQRQPLFLPDCGLWHSLKGLLGWRWV